MEDKMKGFIDAHHDEFDTEIPQEATWDKIVKELPKKRNKNLWLLRIAAAIILMLGVGGLISVLSDDTNPTIAEHQPDDETEAGTESMSFMGGEMEEVEQYYLTQVSLKQKELVNYEVDEELLFEVELLKEEFEALKIEMGQAADPTKVLEAMIENYQMRLEILKDILGEMQKAETSKNTSNKDEKIL